MKLANILSIPLILACASVSGQMYLVGDVVDDYSFTDFTTGDTVTLYELGSQGGVLVLEWFAWWCPFCTHAAPLVRSGIVDYYAAQGGNPYGLPVRHIGLNVQGGARSQSQKFIDTYQIETVVEDYNRDFFHLFDIRGGQPLFAVINAEPNSPSAKRWELLYVRYDYFNYQAPDVSVLMRPVIDSIEPGSASDPVQTVFPEISAPVDGWYQSNWFGWFYGADFPLINHLEFGYGYLAPAAGDNIFFYDLNLHWLFTGQAIYPYLYFYKTGNWLLYLTGSNGEWFYDYNTMSWRTSGDLEQ